MSQTFHVSTVAWHMSQEDAWPSGRDTQDVGRTNTSARSSTTSTIYTPTTQLWADFGYYSFLHKTLL